VVILEYLTRARTGSGVRYVGDLGTLEYPPCDIFVHPVGAVELKSTRPLRMPSDRTTGGEPNRNRTYISPCGARALRVS